MKVAMKNTKTGEIKLVKVGWSWVLFFFSTLFGIPLFLRRLYVWGGVFLALSAISIILSKFVQDGGFYLGPVFFGLVIFMSIKGNEMTAKNYIENGWEFAEPSSEPARAAKARWGITV